MSKGATQPTVRETADDTKRYELNTNLPDENQGKTAKGVQKTEQSTEDKHDTTGLVEVKNKGGHGHFRHNCEHSGSHSNEEKNQQNRTERPDFALRYPYITPQPRHVGSVVVQNIMQIRFIGMSCRR